MATNMPMDPKPFDLSLAVTDRRIPVVIDSPHSWEHWPENRATKAPMSAIRTSWDAYVNDIWRQAVAGRAPVLSACFHRSLIDANRARNDIEPALLSGSWPETLYPSSMSARGFGLIRRLALPGVDMYNAPLPVSQVQQLLTMYYGPYHAALHELIESTRKAFGYCVHLDCHSMKSVGNAMNTDVGQVRPDIVVSDLHGTSSRPEVTRTVADLLRQQGFNVNVNDPYAGAELVRRHGRPDNHCFSIQIEVNRTLYMDEKSYQPHAGYDRLISVFQKFLTELPQHLARP